MDYNKKRNPDKTPKLISNEETGNDHKLIFVVHRHDASHLHFDFRLESEGVLKSWAVPKGPSMNANDKRLAIMVEDHPLEYAGFEGEIPEGRYGAGSVEIWDSGTWEPDKIHENVAKALNEGSLDFFLHGQKLKGEFVLIKTNYKEAQNSWILKKKKDKDAVAGWYDAKKISSK